MAETMKPKKARKPREPAKSAKGTLRKPNGPIALSEPVGAAADDDLPKGSDVKRHVSTIVALNGKLASIRGEIGATVKSAENDRGIHRQAAALIVKLEQMDETKRASFLRHFRSYCLQMGYGEQANLFEAEDEQRVGAR